MAAAAAGGAGGPDANAWHQEPSTPQGQVLKEIPHLVYQTLLRQLPPAHAREVALCASRVRSSSEVYRSLDLPNLAAIVHAERIIKAVSKTLEHKIPNQDLRERKAREIFDDIFSSTTADEFLTQVDKLFPEGSGDIGQRLIDLREEMYTSFFELLKEQAVPVATEPFFQENHTADEIKTYLNGEDSLEFRGLHKAFHFEKDDDSEIKLLPPEISKFVNLESLTVISSLILFPWKEGAKLKKLSNLKLWGAKLSSLSPVIGDYQQLKRLFLRDCGVTYLPSQIGNLDKLQSLELFSNILHGKLPNSLGLLANLNQCDLPHPKDMPDTNEEEVRALLEPEGKHLVNFQPYQFSHHFRISGSSKWGW